MGDLNILNYRKDKDGMWTAFDSQGRYAKGKTRESAGNNYFLVHKMNTSVDAGYDMDKVDKPL